MVKLKACYCKDIKTWSFEFGSLFLVEYLQDTQVSFACKQALIRVMRPRVRRQQAPVISPPRSSTPGMTLIKSVVLFGCKNCICATFSYVRISSCYTYHCGIGLFLGRRCYIAIALSVSLSAALCIVAKRYKIGLL